MPKSTTTNSGSLWLLLALCALAAAVFTTATRSAERRLAEKHAVRDGLLDDIARRTETSAALSVLREGLENDDQVIESALRERGYAREGDHLFAPAHRTPRAEVPTPR